MLFLKQIIRYNRYENIYTILLAPFPLSYVIAENGCMEQSSAKYHSLAEQDSLYIETEKTESEILYRLCFNQQGKKNVVLS